MGCNEDSDIRYIQRYLQGDNKEGKNIALNIYIVSKYFDKSWIVFWLYDLFVFLHNVANGDANGSNGGRAAWREHSGPISSSFDASNDICNDFTFFAEGNTFFVEGNVFFAEGNCWKSEVLNVQRNEIMNRIILI